jgi:hypothetical protein
MVKNLTKAVQKAKKEASLWAYAAWTLPFAALALIVFEHFIGHADWIAVTIIVITTTFFSISVFWWWWALNKFVVVLQAMKENTDRFDDIKTDLKETRKLVQDLDADTRKWREQKKR